MELERGDPAFQFLFKGYDVFIIRVIAYAGSYFGGIVRHELLIDGHCRHQLVHAGLLRPVRNDEFGAVFKVCLVHLPVKILFQYDARIRLSVPDHVLCFFGAFTKEIAVFFQVSHNFLCLLSFVLGIHRARERFPQCRGGEGKIRHREDDRQGDPDHGFFDKAFQEEEQFFHRFALPISVLSISDLKNRIPGTI